MVGKIIEAFFWFFSSNPEFPAKQEFSKYAYCLFVPDRFLSIFHDMTKIPLVVEWQLVFLQFLPVHQLSLEIAAVLVLCVIKINNVNSLKSKFIQRQQLLFSSARNYRSYILKFSFLEKERLKLYLPRTINNDICHIVCRMWYQRSIILAYSCPVQ